MSAKPLRTRSKSASAERCLRPLGATIDMATPDPKTSNGFSVQGIFAWGFTKRQPGGRGGYRVLSLSGNCCTSLTITYPCPEPIARLHFGQRWEEVGASDVRMLPGSPQNRLLTEQA